MRFTRAIARLAAVSVVAVPLTAGTVTVSAATGQATSGTGAAVDTPNAVWAARATATYDAMQRALYVGPGGHDLYVEDYPTESGDNPYAYLWTHDEAVNATFDLANVPGNAPAYRQALADRFDAFSLYYNNDAARPGWESYLPAPLGPGGDVYYDDNSELGLTFFAAYQADHDPAMLADAELAFRIVRRGWDTNTSLACPGGMDWFDSSANTIRGANITGLAAELAAHLYGATHQSEYLSWAVRAYDWNQTCLQQSPGLYWNDRADDGGIDPTLWSYNSGAMIGTATLLYRDTGRAAYLTQAEQEADGALAYWTQGQRLYDQPAVFDSILFQNLFLLDSVRPEPGYRQLLATYAQQVWQDNRDASTGLFTFQASGGGAPAPGAQVQTLEQSAAVQLFAELAWSPADYYRMT